IRRVKFGNKFKSGIHFIFCPLHWVGLFLPWKLLCPQTKRILSLFIKSVPISHCKSQMVFKGFSSYLPIFIVPLKGQRIITLSSLIFYFPNLLKKIFRFRSCSITHHLINFYLKNRLSFQVL